MILGTIGSILFALGMCVAIVEEWAVRSPKIAIGAIGALVLLNIAVVWEKMKNYYWEEKN